MINGSEVQSPLFELEEFHRKLEDLIAFLNSGSIHEVDVVFGFAWGNEIDDGSWNAQRLHPDQILPRIQSYEGMEFGRFGDDEVEVRLLHEEVSILFCHERDVHLKFVQETALVGELKRLFGI